MNNNCQHTDEEWRALQERREWLANQLIEARDLIDDIQSSLNIALTAIEEFQQDRAA